MGDEQKVFYILKEAKKQDLINPSEVTNLCFVSYINTANHILLEITKKSDNKLSMSEIVILIKFICVLYKNSTLLI